MALGRIFQGPAATGPFFDMPKTTPATSALRKLGIAFKLHTYVYDSGAEHIGLQAAEALDVEPNRVLKTLMVEVDGNPVCCVRKRLPRRGPGAWSWPGGWCSGTSWCLPFPIRSYACAIAFPGSSSNRSTHTGAGRVNG